MKTQKGLGLVSIPMSSVLNSPDMEERQPYQLKESGQDSTLKMWLRLRVCFNIKVFYASMVILPLILTTVNARV